VHELWELNYTQKDMIDTLQGEGFQINDRELIRLRLRLKLLLRESAPRPKRALKKTRVTSGGIQKKAKKKRAEVIPGKGLINQLGNAILAGDSSSEEESEQEEEPESGQEQAPEEPEQDARPIIPEPDTTGLSAEEALRKQLRQQQLQAESDEKWRTRKRRRRTRGWAGLPADAPGAPPRFPSETTIDEAKAYLGLDNDMYREVRERFLDICKEEEIIKKTVAGPEKWAQIVQQLIRENTHLAEVFKQEPEVLQGNDALFRPKGQRALSLDVICMDVTKRLRVLETRMTLADAKNLLGLNPEQTRHVRHAFAEKLKADHFTNKHEAGEEHWAELKQAWVNDSAHLVTALAQGEADPDYSRKLKALEVLARDVMKRQQQEKISKDPSKKKQVHQGPGPGPAPPIVALHPTILGNKTQQSRSVSRPEPPQTPQPIAPALSAMDLQIDPSLLLAASDAAILPVPEYQAQHQYQDRQYQPASQQRHLHPQEYYISQQQQYYQPQSAPTPSSLPMPLPVYFRLHPHSSTPFPAKTVWLSILHTTSIDEVRSLATREHPGTVVHRIEGSIAYKDEQGEREVVLEVADDEEVSAYLEYVRREEKDKATFVVLLGMRKVGG
jgi:hypothetical protein